jgi:hypothetical protein
VVAAVNEREQPRLAILISLSLAGALAGLASCKDGPPEKAVPAFAEERMNLLTNPSLYLHTSGKETAAEEDDASDLPAELRSVVVYNSSHFTVGDLAGDLVWLDDQEQRVGSAPFSLLGSLPPGAAKRFATRDGTMTNGKLKSPASAAQVVFTHVRVID